MENKNPIRIVMADDHSRIHHIVTEVIADADDMILIGQGATGLEAIQICADLRPDVLLLDIMMPQMNGIEAAKMIHQHQPDIRIIALTSFQDEESIYAMLKAGAQGYILKDHLVDELLETIRSIHRGTMVLSMEVANTLMTSGMNTTGTNNFSLTERELEVLKLMAAGLNNNEIATELTISRSTVKFHVANIIEKMGVQTRAEAIVLGAKNDLI